MQSMLPAVAGIACVIQHAMGCIVPKQQVCVAHALLGGQQRLAHSACAGADHSGLDNMLTNLIMGILPHRLDIEVSLANHVQTLQVIGWHPSAILT